MSPLVTCPCMPVPATFDRIDAAFRRHLAHRRRHRHFSRFRRRSGRGLWRLSGLLCRGAAVLGAAPAPSLIWPSSAPTATVSPFFAAISESTPAAGAGTSSVTLSVSSSTSGSSTATASPGCLNHLPTVASVTDSPRVGTRISAMTFLLSRVHHHGRACPGHLRLSFERPIKTWMPGTRPGMTECNGHPSASSRNCLSCARCFDIWPTAVEAEAGRPA